METKEILNELYSMLPDELQDDKFLEDLWNLITNNCTEHSFLVGKISINERLYSKLDFNLISEDKVLSRNDDMIMSFLVVAKENVLLKIRFDDGKYLIEVKIPNKDYMTIIKAEKDDTMTKLITIKENKDDGIYDFYECDVKYYDNGYNELLDEEADKEVIEREKDRIFATEFALPISVARFFRLNFNKYKKQLSSNLLSTLIERYNESLSEDDLFRFCSPFKLEELEQYAALFETRELEVIRKEAGEDIFIDSDTDPRTDISTLKNNLLGQIGEGMITMSYNMVSDIGELVNGKIEMMGLSTKGYIVKKENEDFSLYRISINKGIVSIIRETVTKDDAILLFNKDYRNEKIEGLKDFFTGNRGLK